jgi:hypothetical protein
LGYRALYYNVTGNYNVAVGMYALKSNNGGSRNTALGYKAGNNAGAASGNVFLGFEAGYSETGSNLLYIENTVSSSPLIWGDFQSDKVVINGNGSNNTSGRTLFVNGEAGGTSAWFNDSDRRLKKNISTIDRALEKVNNLRGVNFEWKDQSKYSQGLQMGFIAQEVEQVVPEVVDPSGDHYTMQYAPLTALLVEAVKELSARNKELSKKETDLISENKTLTHKYEELKKFEEELSLRIAKLEHKNHINEVANRDSR